jgi:hypothetical protein
MQKLITRICWTNHGVQDFTDEVNNYLEEGWTLASFLIEKKGFRFVCYALLVDMPLEPELEVAE